MSYADLLDGEGAQNAAGDFKTAAIMALWHAHAELERVQDSYWPKPSVALLLAEIRAVLALPGARD